ncbi:MAG: site-specific integrase, partial [Actinobacteria bacterium]|nr:site-specific integrase [Actinomycetota bacterium]
LDRPLEEWERLLAASTGIRPAEGNRGVLYRAFLRWSYGELSQLCDVDPFLSDRWDVRLVKPNVPARNRWVDWSGIPQPWLREAAKRWGRVRITTQGAATVTRDAYHLTDFASFLQERTSVRAAADITRSQIEGYIGRLSVNGTSDQARSRYLGTLRQFLTAASEQELLKLHPSATVRLGDLPTTARVLPRFLPDRVMAVLEAPESLALLPDLVRNLVKVLMGTGRRASEGCTLAFDSLVDGPDGEPYLRYFAGKIRKEQMIPLDPATAAAIRDQQVQVLRLWTGGSAWLFPRPRCNPFARYPMRYETLKYALQRWARELDLREPLPADAPLGAEAPLVDLTSHRFRHTIATRMINEDVPACVVQRFLGHDSPAMTQRYTAVHDKTLREAFDRYRNRVTSEGRVIVYERDSPMSEGMRLAERLKRARQTLANGYCARPVQTDCIHPNFCHGCTQFVSDVTFLPVLRGQRDRATKMRDRCVEEDRPKWAERNERDVAALNPIIAALEALPEAADFAP